MKFDFDIYVIDGNVGKLKEFISTLPFSLPENMKEDIIYKSEFQNYSKNNENPKQFSLIKTKKKIDNKFLKTHINAEFTNYCKEHGLSYVPKSMKKEIENEIKEKFLKTNSSVALSCADFILCGKYLLSSHSDNGLGLYFLKFADNCDVKIEFPKEERLKLWSEKLLEWIEITKKDDSKYKIEKINLSNGDGKVTLTQSLTGITLSEETTCNVISITDGFTKYTLYSNNPYRVKINNKHIDCPNEFIDLWTDITNNILGE